MRPLPKDEQGDTAGGVHEQDDEFQECENETETKPKPVATVSLDTSSDDEEF